MNTEFSTIKLADADREKLFRPPVELTSGGRNYIWTLSVQVTKQHTTTFPDLLRECREAAGLTLQEVADKLKTDFSLVSKWERGARKPARDEVASLARVLKADRKELLVAYLRDKVLYEVQDDEFAMEALKAAEAQVKYQANKTR